MRGQTARAFVACLVGMSLVAAACGGDDGDDAAGTTTTAAAAASTTSTTADAESTTSSAAGTTPTSLEEWEQLWADQRAAIVERIEDNGWGLSADGTTLTGPEGWTVDLSTCPSNWSNTEGINGETIKIGISLAQSGTYADYGNLGKAEEFLWNYFNDQGLFQSEGKTMRVEVIAKDDGYDATRTIPNVDELLDSEKVFAIQTLGSPNTLKVYGKINERCVPNPIVMTAHAAWGDPVNHPWTTGAPNPTYSTEAILWGAFIEQHIDEFPTDRKIKVASLVQNNDFGKLYGDTFEAVIQDSPILRDRVEYVSETIEAAAPTVTDPMTTLAAEEPDVWITMLAGTQCTQIVSEAAQNGMKAKAKYLFMPQTCAGATFISKEKLGGDGSAGDGWWLLSPGQKDMKDPAFDDDPFISWLKEAMAEEGLDYNASSNLSAGINYGFPIAMALAIAGELDGGINRTNFQLALRSMDMTSPMLREGLRMHMNGLKDAYLVEGGLFQRWNAEKQTYENQGEIIDLDGKAKLCAWDQSTSTCR